MSVRELVPTLARASGLIRKLDAVRQAYLVDDTEGVDTLLTAIDVAELRGVAIELDAIVLRHSLSVVPSPEPAATSPLARGRLAHLDPHSRRAR